MRYIWLLLLLLVMRPPSAWAADDELIKGMDELLATESDWHLPGWQYRQRLTVGGPSLGLAPRLVVIEGVSPLLLYNTRPCSPGLVDLRVLDMQGRELPCGVLHFGRDDGSSRIWYRLAEPPPAEQMLWFYYGNPAIKGEPPAPPPGVHAEELVIRVLQAAQEESRAPAVAEATGPASFFQQVQSFEAETLGAPSVPVVGASAGAVLRFSATLTELRLPFESPEAGPRQLWLRVGAAAGVRGVMLALDGESMGTAAPATEVAFAWRGFDRPLAAGPHELLLRGDPGAVLDLMVISRDPRYLPDYQDLTGPVWLRYRLLAPAGVASYGSWYCVHTPYSAMGMLGQQAGWHFGQQWLAHGLESGRVQASSAPLVPAGAWSAWGQGLHSPRYTAFSHLTLFGEDDKPLPPGLRWEVQFATRPSAERVYRQSPANQARLQIRMPTALTLTGEHGLLAQTRTFAEWAEDRFALAQRLGFKEGEGPKQLSVGFMADNAEQPQEFEYVVKTAAWLGCNTLNLNYADPDFYAKTMAANGITGYFFHPWAGNLSPTPETPVPAGQSALQALEAHFERQAQLAFSNWSFNQVAYLQRQPWNQAHLRFAILGDEIREVIGDDGINQTPLVRQAFHEFLAKQGLTPAFFGVAEWAAVRADDLVAPEAVPEVPAMPAAGALAETAEAAEDLAQLGEMQRTEAQDPPAVAPLAPQLKRQYYWTQRFRSEYYARYYAAWTRAKFARFPATSRGAVNLQADLTQRGRMWQGQCDLWDHGRLQAFDAMMTEDWSSSPLGVAFGYELLRAASRGHGQPLASLIVGQRPGLRTLVNLAQECRYLYYYLYGPVHRIGPVWAEHEPTLRDIGETLRLVARSEPAILAARRVPALAAVLVSNASEINSSHRFYPLGKARQAVYQALLHAQVEAEVVGEQELLLADALARYKVIYLTDPWVQRATWERLRQWVNGGGVLWAGYAAMSHDEYDEPLAETASFFGVAARTDTRLLAGVDESWNRREAWPGLENVYQELPLATGSYRSHWFAPGWQVTEAEVLHRFADKSPAVLTRAVGQGRVFLAGLTLVRDDLTGLPAGSDAGRALGQAQAEWVLLAARAAKVAPLATPANPGLLLWRHQGPQQTVLYLINTTGRALSEPLTVRLAAPVTAVYSSRHDRPVASQLSDQGVQLSLTLANGEGDILVFTHP